MPTRNRVKIYENNAYYHCYNRGVDGMPIFRDEQDRKVYLYYIKIVFSGTEFLEKELAKVTKDGPIYKAPALARSLARAIWVSMDTKIFEQVELLNFSLMPNHIHLQIYQKSERGIEEVMRRVGSGYSTYFNKKYQRRGPLYESRYKASLLNLDPPIQSLLLGDYIENNVRGVLKRLGLGAVHEYPYSSYKYYHRQLKENTPPPVWLNTQRLLQNFASIKENPRSPFEDKVAKHADFLDFIENLSGISLEDLRLAYLDAFTRDGLL